MNVLSLTLTFGYHLLTTQLEMARVYELSRAISICEGFPVRGSLPNRMNNPGSLSGDSGLFYYPTTLQGWNATNYLVWRHKDESIEEMGKWWAEDPNWSNCVKSKYETINLSSL